MRPQSFVAPRPRLGRDFPAPRDPGTPRPRAPAHPGSGSPSARGLQAEPETGAQEPGAEIGGQTGTEEERERERDRARGRWRWCLGAHLRLHGCLVPQDGCRAQRSAAELHIGSGGATRAEPPEHMPIDDLLISYAGESSVIPYGASRSSAASMSVASCCKIGGRLNRFEQARPIRERERER